MKKLLMTLSIVLVSLSAHGQKVAISTNALDWANLLTINGQFNYAVSQHISLNAAVRYNNWNWGGSEDPFQNKARTASLGLRWWPWNVYSSWFFGVKAQVEEYNWGNYFKCDTEEGRAYGGCISFGYALMLSSHWNLDIGAGAFLGMKKYTQYACPRCGAITGEGSKFFVLPSNDVQVSIVYIF